MVPTREQAREEAAREQAAWEAQETFKSYPVSTLRAVFAKIADPADWKGPIAARMSGEAVMAAVAAIEFFTATVPTVSLDTWSMVYRVESAGYRGGPAGDH